jgi:uncharacterized UBP type Zn finger protein
MSGVGMGLVENARFVFQRLLGRRRPCPHVAAIRDVSPESTEGCPECLAAGDTWKALRMCMTCGHVGCCDSSKNKHASRHAASAGHPILRSIQPGEDWMWCVVDSRLVEPPRD